jgi:hypothetical protein
MARAIGALTVAGADILLVFGETLCRATARR